MDVFAKLRAGTAHAVGWPFVNRALGPNPLRNLAAGGALTAVLATLNVGYYMSLLSQQQFMLNRSDRMFLEYGLDGVAGTLDFQIMCALGAIFLLVAPTLACQNVIKEGTSRTLDALFTTPLSALALHNGFAFGSIAKFLPFLAPAFVLHVGLGVAGFLDVSTVLSTSALLIVGSWALTSFGVMIGVLLKSRAKGPLAGLLMFLLLGLMLGLPMTAPFESGDEYLAALGPASAMLHSLLTDSNPWLASIEHGPALFYDGAFLSLPVSVPVVSLACVFFIGFVSTHVSRRRLESAESSLMSHHVALAGGAFVSLVASVMLGLAIRESWGSAMDPYYYSNTKEMIGVSWVVTLAGLAWALMAMPSVLYAKSTLRRNAVQIATGSPVGRLRNIGTAGLLAIVVGPVLLGLLFPALTDAMSWNRILQSNNGTRWLFVIPMVWGVVGFTQLFKCWQFSKQKGWHAGLLLMTVMGLSIMTLVYSTIALDQSNLRLNDLMPAPADAGGFLGVTLLVVFVTAPALFTAMQIRRRADLSLKVNYLVANCESRASVAQGRVAWPEKGEPVDTFRADMCPPERDVALLGRARKREPVFGKRTLILRDTFLECHHGASVQSIVDLSRPFSVEATRGTGISNGGVALSITITQRGVVSGKARVAFAMLVQKDDVNVDLPLMDQSLPVVAEREAETFLHAIHFYARVHGDRPVQLHNPLALAA